MYKKMFNTSKKGVSMKRQFIGLLLLLGAIAPVAQAQTTASASASSFCACTHSFFSVRPPFQASTPERVTIFRDAALKRDCGWGGAFQIVPFGGKSTNSKRFARFFTPNCKDCVIFAETGFDTLLANPNNRDVNAHYFNISTAAQNFASRVCFRPQQKYAGVGFDWKQYLGWWRCDNPCPRWWFEISFPVLHVKNDMRLTESIINQGTVPTTLPAGATVNTNIIQAFTGVNKFVNLNSGGAYVVTGSGWLYGRIDGSQKKTGVADLEFKLGYDYLSSECCHLDGYIGFVAPTGNKPKAHYLWEPIVGNNHHWGVMWGGSFGGVIWEGCDMDLRLEMETNGRYLFRNTQRRSFDVNGKPWSRYMLVYTSAAAAAAETPTEGINLFTRKLHVKPHVQQHLNTGLVFDWCRFQAEIGWHVWAAQCERVSLKDPFPTGLAFAALTQTAPFDATIASNINRAITIKENFEGAAVAYATPLTIIENDLNLESAAMPCALTQTIYGSLGYQTDWCWPIFFGIGGSYEWTPKHAYTALNRWMVWGKIGVSI
jgi:hypothetical protein